MAATVNRSSDPAPYPDGAPAIASAAVAWSAIFAGAVAAIALTLVLVMIGSAFGLGAVSPWPGVGARPASFAIGAGLWLIVTQWLSSLMGGYLAGRLRTRWHGLHTDEVFFRDTAHGFITWALATVVMALVAVVAVALTPAPASPDVAASRETLEAARKTAAAFAGFGGIALVIGAFVAAAAGALGGRLRDLHP